MVAMRFWSSVTHKLSFGQRHTPHPGETIPDLEPLQCWNCGGELLIETGDGEGNMIKNVCPLCEAEGEVMYSTEPIDYQADWNIPGNPNTPRVISTECNLTHSYFYG